MAVQVGEHAGERVDVGVDLGVIAGWVFRTAVLRARQTRENVRLNAVDCCAADATEDARTINS